MNEPDAYPEVCMACRAEIERLRKALQEERDYVASCEADLEHLWLAIEKIMEENR